jgi:hypothetical protein
VAGEVKTGEVNTEAGDEKIGEADESGEVNMGEADESHEVLRESSDAGKVADMGE